MLLNTEKRYLTLLSVEPLYIHFTIPKKNGKLRHIEAPEPDLKRIQRKLNVFLQSFYFINQSKASYGFVINPKHNKNPKNIKTNAEKHLGNRFMLNADFEDFFHQISSDLIFQLFIGEYFNFNKQTAHLLTQLCTYKERLPMGTPTSPVLSNIYTIPLDKQLTNWSNKNNIIYTRYVDDLCFSSNTIIASTHFTEINNLVTNQNLKFNTNKTKYYKASDQKTVLGLNLNETIDIDLVFYHELDKDIIRLKNTVETIFITDRTNNTSSLKQFKQEIMGKINFIAIIEGYDSKEYLKYIMLYENALQPSENLLLRWTKFNNYL